MSSRKLNRVVALAVAAALLLAAPAAWAAGGRVLAPAGLRGGESAGASWLAPVWGWWSSVWEEEGSGIDPNGGKPSTGYGTGQGGTVAGAVKVRGESNDPAAKATG